MGLFGSLFGNSNKSDLPPEIESIFSKLSDFLGDESQQNSKMPPQMKQMLEKGESVDEISGAHGEFGKCLTNPIPVNGPIGELVYLSRLAKLGTDAKILFHRLGSINTIDIYETVSIDGLFWDFLYFSYYHPRKSRIAPKGYIIRDVQSQPLFYGTNRNVPDFPIGLQSAIRDTTENMLGIPLPPPEVREVEESVKFSRPESHIQALKALKNSELTLGTG